MRARLNSAVRAEQHVASEHAFQTHLEALLSQLVAAVLSGPLAIAAQRADGRAVHLSPEAVRGWSAPELTPVVPLLCEMDALIEQRALASVSGAASSSSTSPQLDRQEENHINAISSTDDGNGDSSKRYSFLINCLIEKLVDPVTQSTLARATNPNIPSLNATTTAADNACVRLPVEADVPSSFFRPGSVVVVPWGIYVGWRCCYRLLSSLQRALGVSKEDAAAGWLDVTTGMLDSLNRVAYAVSSAKFSSADDLQEGGPTAVSVATVDAFARCAAASLQVTHCYWWWWCLTFAFGRAHGWLPPPSAAVSDRDRNDEERNSTPVEAFLPLWRAGLSSAVGFLSGVVHPQAAHALTVAMTSVVCTTSPLGGRDSGPHMADATTARMQAFVRAIDTLQQLSLHLFPAASLIASPEEAVALDDGVAHVAPEVLVRRVLHDALRPLAEHILDDPTSLQLAATSHPAPPLCTAYEGAGRTTAIHTTAASALDGWSDEEEESEGAWSEQVITAQTRNVERKTSSDCEGTPPLDGRFSVPGNLPRLTSPYEALAWVLDSLEVRWGDMVRHDSIAMTLRRL